MIAWDQWNSGGAHDLLGRTLRTHGLDGRYRRTDEDDAGFGARGCEARVLSKETIARMDRSGTAVEGSLQNPVANQVTVAGRCGTNPEGFIGLNDVHCLGIGIGEDRHRGDAKTS